MTVYRDLGDAVEVALERMGAVMEDPDGAHLGEIITGGRASLVLTGLDVDPDELFKMIDRSVAAYALAAITSGELVKSMLGLAQSWYMIGRLHDPERGI